MRVCSCGDNYIGKGTKCRPCRYKLEKEKNPVKFAYDTWRRNAKRRGKFFDVTLEEFKEFCIEYEYMNKRGTSATGLHIDRANETKGYTKGNLRALENTDNVKKYIKWKGRDLDGKNEFETVTTGINSPNKDVGDVPF